MQIVDPVQSLKAAISIAGSQEKFARQHCFALSFIGDVMRGVRPMSPRLGATIGIKRVWVRCDSAGLTSPEEK